MATDPDPTNADLAKPAGLSAAGDAAWSIIVRFLGAHRLTFTGGCKAFYAPATWIAGGRRAPLGSAVLIVCHDGGSVPRAVRWGDFPELYEALAAELDAEGLYLQSLDVVSTAVYPTRRTVNTQEPAAVGWAWWAGCAYPKYIGLRPDVRCGVLATAVRRPIHGLPPAPLCAEHAAAYERARGYRATDEEKALTAQHAAAEEEAVMGAQLRTSRRDGGP